jgi:hypothetical protein
MNKLGIVGNAGIRFKKFDTGKNLKLMDRTKIGKAMLSISTPGVYVRDDRTSWKIDRLCNDSMKRTVAEPPGRYGGLGVLPFPALGESLIETEHILDFLQLDGIGVLTSAGGICFGAPVLRALPFHRANRVQIAVERLPGKVSPYPARSV